MNPLAGKKGSPTRGAGKILKGKDLAKYKKQLKGGWKIVRGHHLEKEFKFKDFRSALAFTNKVGRAAETQGHHPDVFLAWGKVKLTIWDHHTDGLIEADFVLAAKANRAYG